MALVSKETLDKLKINSANFLAECEPLLCSVSNLRTKLGQSQSETNKSFDTPELIIKNTIDVILCDFQILFDAVSSLNFLLRSEEEYEKRFGLQCLNLCFCESVTFWTQDEDKYTSPLIQLKNLCKEIQLLGHYHLLCHVLNDINSFESTYLNKVLRDSFRHRSDIQELYRQQLALVDEDLTAKGVCRLMDICLQLSVVCNQLLGISSVRVEKATAKEPPFQSVFGDKNKLFLTKFSDEDLITRINGTITNCAKNIDSCYECARMVDKAEKFLPEEGQNSKQFRDLVLFRMHANYLSADVLCAIRGFLQAQNDFERAQNLRLIYITKQACLTQLYGYNDTTRSNSLWKSIISMNSEVVTTDDRINPEDQLSKLTTNLEEDRNKSNRSAHYVNKDVFYVPDRIDSIKNLDYEREIKEGHL